MLLNEIFNSERNRQRAIRWNGDHGEFNFGEFKYVVQLLHLTRNHPLYRMSPPNSPLSANTYFFGFAAQNKRTGEFSDKSTNAGTPIPVMSTIIQDLQNKVNEVNADIVYLGCRVDDEKRSSLYQALVSKYTKSGDWNVIDEFNSNYGGVVMHMWIVQKSQA